MGYKVKRLTEGLIHKNFVLISAGGVGPVNPLTQ